MAVAAGVPGRASVFPPRGAQAVPDMEGVKIPSPPLELCGVVFADIGQGRRMTFPAEPIGVIVEGQVLLEGIGGGEEARPRGKAFPHKRDITEKPAEEIESLLYS